MNQLPLLSLEGLRDHQQRALIAWQQQHATSAIFRAWSEVYQAWNSVDAETQEVWLGHVAVLWQELNAICEGRDWLPLLNQFVQVSFRGIARKMPRDFAPPLAADAASWHRVFEHSVQKLATSNAPAERPGEIELCFDGMLSQYATVFAKRINKTNRTILQGQLDQLDRARECQQSELLLVGTIDWHTDASAAPLLLDLLAEILLLASTTPDVVRALLPEGRSEVLAIRQLLGFWARRATWFNAALRRYAPQVLVTPPGLPPSTVHALPAPHGCDEYAILVAERGARSWLFAGEAACPALAVAGLDADLTGLRSQWQTGAIVEDATTTPQLMAVCEPSAMCRVMCWEIPPGYFRTSSGPAALAPDASMVRLCDDILTSQRPGCVIAVFDHGQLQTRPVAEVNSSYVNAATKLAQHTRHSGAANEGVHWFLVFDGVPVPSANLNAQLDAQLASDFESALRGALPEGLISAAGNSAETFMNAALAHPLCAGSLALAHRVAQDLSSVAPLLNALGHYGFARITLAYTRSTALEAAAWPSFSRIWSGVREALASNSFFHRKAYLEQRFVKELVEHASVRGQAGGIGHSLPVGLTELGNASQGTARHSDESLSALWQNLLGRVGQETFSAGHFESLWLAGEAARTSQRAVASAQLDWLSRILATLLAELGIPDQPLANFSWSAERAPTPDAAPTEEHWQRLVALANKPQPVRSEDEELLSLSQFHAGYHQVHGSLSHHCLLKDFGPETATASILYEHGAIPLTRLLINPGVELDNKLRLILSLRGYATPNWRTQLAFQRGERDPLKHQVLASVWRDMLIADLLLIHLVRLSARAGMTLAVGGGQGGGKWHSRRAQLLRLLDTGGWNAEKASEDPLVFGAALERLIDLWKEFYKNRGPHRTKQRKARADSLKEEYEQLRKPMTVPAIHVDLTTEKAQELERSAYLAAYTVELIARIPERATGSTSQASAQHGIDIDEYCAKAKTLIEQYTVHKGRYLVRAAAYQLEAAQWLRGYGPQIELVGRDVLAAPQVAPGQLAQRLSSAVSWAIQQEEGRIASSGPSVPPPRRSPPPPPSARSSLPPPRWGG